MNCQFVVIEDKLLKKLKREIRREQVKKLSLDEYKVGSPRHTKLIEAMEMARRFEWPGRIIFNM